MDIKKNLNRWLTGHRPKSRDQEPQVVVLAPAPVAEAVEPEIVAVIAAVVAVEVKMFMALQGRSFTFNEGGQPQGWSELGRLLVHPYQGVHKP